MRKIDKWMVLRARLRKLGIQEDDLAETFILGSGKGGQKLHKTASCVCLRHHPTGIVIKCQKYRSREQNRYAARELLCEKIEEKIEKQRLAIKQAREKTRRQKRKRTRGEKERVLEQKRQRSKTKELRKRPRDEE